MGVVVPWGVVWRAQAVIWLRHARRRVTWPLALTILGLGGGLAGGALIGEWCLGLILIAESALLVAVGLFRDDGSARPVVGEHTVADVLRAEARRP